MAIYAEVSEEGQEELQRELKKNINDKWYRKLRIIQLSSEGYKVPALASIFDMCSAAVRGYIKRYNESGIAGLKHKPKSGKPPKVPQVKEYWEEVLRQSPCQFEKLETGARNWNQGLIVEYCLHYLDAEITQPGISGLFKRLGIRWNRSRLRVTSPDPEYIVKRKRIDTLKKSPRESVK